MNITKEILNEYKNKKLLNIQYHPTLPLQIINYSRTVQFDNLWDEVTTYCRNLILDLDCNLIARSFSRFKNFEQLTNEEIPDCGYWVQEKLDGSLINLFYYNNEWIFASKGSFTSIHSIKAKEIFEKKYKLEGYNRLKPEYNYIFEVVFPENRIVVNYENEEKLIFLSAFKGENEIKFENIGQELGLFNWNFDIVNSQLCLRDERKDDDFLVYKSKNLKNREGYVMLFLNGFRMKIKFEDYCKLHKVSTGVSNYTVLEHLKNNTFNELLELCPDEMYNWIKETKDQFELEHNKILNSHLFFISDLNFKLLKHQINNNTLFSSILFNLLNSDSVEDFKNSKKNKLKICDYLRKITPLTHPYLTH